MLEALRALRAQRQEADAAWFQARERGQPLGAAMAAQLDCAITTERLVRRCRALPLEHRSWRELTALLELTPAWAELWAVERALLERVGTLAGQEEERALRASLNRRGAASRRLVEELVALGRIEEALDTIPQIRPPVQAVRAARLVAGHLEAAERTRLAEQIWRRLPLPRPDEEPTTRFGLRAEALRLWAPGDPEGIRRAHQVAAELAQLPPLWLEGSQDTRDLREAMACAWAHHGQEARAFDWFERLAPWRHLSVAAVAPLLPPAAAEKLYRRAFVKARVRTRRETDPDPRWLHDSLSGAPEALRAKLLGDIEPPPPPPPRRAAAAPSGLYTPWFREHQLMILLEEQEDATQRAGVALYARTMGGWDEAKQADVLARLHAREAHKPWGYQPPDAWHLWLEEALASGDAVAMRGIFRAFAERRAHGTRPDLVWLVRRLLGEPAFPSLLHFLSTALTATERLRVFASVLRVSEDAPEARLRPLRDQLDQDARTMLRQHEPSAWAEAVPHVRAETLPLLWERRRMAEASVVFGDLALALRLGGLAAVEGAFQAWAR